MPVTMSSAATENLCKEFNARYYPGHPVLVIRDDGKTDEAVIKYPATVFQKRAMIGVSGIAGLYCLDRIIPLKTSSTLMRPFNDGQVELEIKVIRLAAQICRMHGNVAGGRHCQDWTDHYRNLSALSDKERDQLHWICEQYNSKGNDYEPGYFPMDEMVISFVVAAALWEMGKGPKGQKLAGVLREKEIEEEIEKEGKDGN